MWIGTHVYMACVYRTHLVNVLKKPKQILSKKITESYVERRAEPRTHVRLSTLFVDVAPAVFIQWVCVGVCALLRSYRAACLPACQMMVCIFVWRTHAISMCRLQCVYSKVSPFFFLIPLSLARCVCGQYIFSFSSIYSTYSYIQPIQCTAMYWCFSIESIEKRIYQSAETNSKNCVRFVVLDANLSNT